MSTNPEKPNLEAALSSTPVAPKKSRFRPTFRSPRIPRETKLGLGIIFSLVCVFGYVLYSRLTRPADMDPETYVAQGNSLLAPSVTSGQPTNLVAQPAGQTPTVLPGTAPQQAMPLANHASSPTAPSQFSAPAGGAGQPSWTPNSSSSTVANTAGSDPFMNRGASMPSNPEGAAASFSANGFNANSTANSTPKQPTATGYGLSDTNDNAETPANSFLPPADRASAGTAAMNASLSPSEHAATTSLANDSARSVATGNTANSPVDAFNKSATDSLNKLRQEGQDLVNSGMNSGTTAQQNLGKASDSANQLLGQAQQQLGQYTNSTNSNVNSLLNQAKDASAQYGNDLKSAATQYGSDLKQSATQYGTDLKNDVQNQAGQYTNQLRNTAQDQFQAAQNQLTNSANNLVNDTTNQFRAGTESVMSKAGESTQNVMNSATTAMNGGQPLSPLPTTGATTSATSPTNSYGMPAAAPRTLDASQPLNAQPLSAQPLSAQPLSAANPNSAAYSMTASPEQPIRIPTEPSSFTTQPNAAQPTMATAPNTMTSPNYGTATATPNYGAPAAATTPNYGTPPATPNYGSTPNYGTPATPAASGTPLQFNTPTMPASQPTSPVYGGATRTNFEQPAPSSAAPTTRGVQQYTVTAQDSYYSVAEKMYGNGAFNKALYEYNRRNNPAADRLQVGGAMLIPDLATLQAQFPDLAPSTNGGATATINPTPLQFPR
jgi:ElaB/YqjD/DUF883 family membrane-anchored ribosome-binding protein